MKRQFIMIEDIDDKLIYADSAIIAAKNTIILIRFPGAYLGKGIIYYYITKGMYKSALDPVFAGF